MQELDKGNRLDLLLSTASGSEARVAGSDDKTYPVSFHLVNVMAAEFSFLQTLPISTLALLSHWWLWFVAQPPPVSWLPQLQVVSCVRALPHATEKFLGRALLCWTWPTMSLKWRADLAFWTGFAGVHFLSVATWGAAVRMMASSDSVRVMTNHALCLSTPTILLFLVHFNSSMRPWWVIPNCCYCAAQTELRHRGISSHYQVGCVLMTTSHFPIFPLLSWGFHTQEYTKLKIPHLEFTWQQGLIDAIHIHYGILFKLLRLQNPSNCDLWVDILGWK